MTSWGGQSPPRDARFTSSHSSDTAGRRGGDATANARARANASGTPVRTSWNSFVDHDIPISVWTAHHSTRMVDNLVTDSAEADAKAAAAVDEDADPQLFDLAVGARGVPWQDRWEANGMGGWRSRGMEAKVKIKQKYEPIKKAMPMAKIPVLEKPTAEVEAPEGGYAKFVPPVRKRQNEEAPGAADGFRARIVHPEHDGLPPSVQPEKEEAARAREPQQTVESQQGSTHLLERKVPRASFAPVLANTPAPSSPQPPPPPKASTALPLPPMRAPEPPPPPSRRAPIPLPPPARVSTHTLKAASIPPPPAPQAPSSPPPPPPPKALSTPLQEPAIKLAPDKPPTVLVTEVAAVLSTYVAEEALEEGAPAMNVAAEAAQNDKVDNTILERSAATETEVMTDLAEPEIDFEMLAGAVVHEYGEIVEEVNADECRLIAEVVQAEKAAAIAVVERAIATSIDELVNVGCATVAAAADAVVAKEDALRAEDAAAAATAALAEALTGEVANKMAADIAADVLRTAKEATAHSILEESVVVERAATAEEVMDGVAAEAAATAAATTLAAAPVTQNILEIGDAAAATAADEMARDELLKEGLGQFIGQEATGAIEQETSEGCAELQVAAVTVAESAEELAGPSGLHIRKGETVIMTMANGCLGDASEEELMTTDAQRRASVAAASTLLEAVDRRMQPEPAASQELRTTVATLGAATVAPAPVSIPATPRAQRSSEQGVAPKSGAQSVTQGEDEFVSRPHMRRGNQGAATLDGLQTPEPTPEPKEEILGSTVEVEEEIDPTRRLVEKSALTFDRGAGERVWELVPELVVPEPPPVTPSPAPRMPVPRAQHISPSLPQSPSLWLQSSAHGLRFTSPLPPNPPSARRLHGRGRGGGGGAHGMIHRQTVREQNVVVHRQYMKKVKQVEALRVEYGSGGTALPDVVCEIVTQLSKAGVKAPASWWLEAEHQRRAHLAAMFSGASVPLRMASAPRLDGGRTSPRPPAQSLVQFAPGINDRGEGRYNINPPPAADYSYNHEYGFDDDGADGRMPPNLHHELEARPRPVTAPVLATSALVDRVKDSAGLRAPRLLSTAAPLSAPRGGDQWWLRPSSASPKKGAAAVEAAAQRRNSAVARELGTSRSASMSAMLMSVEQAGGSLATHRLSRSRLSSTAPSRFAHGGGAAAAIATPPAVPAAHRVSQSASIEPPDIAYRRSTLGGHRQRAAESVAAARRRSTLGDSMRDCLLDDEDNISMAWDGTSPAEKELPPKFRATTGDPATSMSHTAPPTTMPGTTVGVVIKGGGGGTSLTRTGGESSHGPSRSFSSGSRRTSISGQQKQLPQPRRGSGTAAGRAATADADRRGDDVDNIMGWAPQAPPAPPATATKAAVAGAAYLTRRRVSVPNSVVLFGDGGGDLWSDAAVLPASPTGGYPSGPGSFGSRRSSVGGVARKPGRPGASMYPLQAAVGGAVVGGQATPASSWAITHAVPR